MSVFRLSGYLAAKRARLPGPTGHKTGTLFVFFIFVCPTSRAAETGERGGVGPRPKGPGPNAAARRPKGRFHVPWKRNRTVPDGGERSLVDSPPAV